MGAPWAGSLPMVDWLLELWKEGVRRCSILVLPLVAFSFICRQKGLLSMLFKETKHTPVSLLTVARRMPASQVELGSLEE